jgi:hypothetical protein
MEIFNEFLNDNPFLGLTPEQRKELLESTKERYISETANPSLIKDEPKINYVISNMYDLFVGDRIPKWDKKTYNAFLWMAIKRYELVEEYDKCDKLKELYLEIPEDYQSPKCSFNLNPILVGAGFEPIPEEELFSMTDEECVIKMIQLSMERNGEEYVYPGDNVVKFILKRIRG